MVRWRIMPVYLCNRTDQAIRDIKINTVGTTTHLSMSTPSGSAPLSTTPTSLTIEQLAPNTAALRTSTLAWMLLPILAPTALSCFSLEIFKQAPSFLTHGWFNALLAQTNGPLRLHDRHPAE